MNKILDKQSEIKKIDKSSVYESVIALPKQCEKAWNEASKIEIPSSYLKTENLVMCGMGGSGLAARVVENLFFDELKIPLVRINDYNLPNFVDEKSFVFCSSYSGSTEETIENIKQAITKKAKWMAISTGSTVIELAKQYQVPFYRIEAKHNPCNQPRMAVGYSIVGQLALLNKLKIINITESDIAGIIETMNEIIVKNNIEVESSRNLAKTEAAKLKDKTPILISAQHLIGTTHIFNNQINENSKVFSVDFPIPELNHHLMEGLKYPLSNKSSLHFLFIDSNYYFEKTKKRFVVTKDVICRNGINFSEIKLNSKDKFNEVFELIQLGAFINFYLSILYKQNPAPIPWVDYFKKELSVL